MTAASSNRLWEALLYLVVIALAISTLLYDSGQASVHTDALGPTAFPRYTAVLLLCLIAIRFVQSRRSSPSSATPEQTGNHAERLKIFGMLIIIVGFIALVSLSWLPFWLCIALFLGISILFLTDTRKARELLLILIFALIFGACIAYIVQTFFYFSL